MSDAIRRIIVDHTGTTQTDLGRHVIKIVLNAEPVPWDRPKSVARDAADAAKKLRSAIPSLRQLAEHVECAPELVDDGRAAAEALKAVERAIAVAKHVEDTATSRAQAIMEFEGLKQESDRDWRPDMIALAAAEVYSDLRGDPGFYSGSPTPYERMVKALFTHYGIKAQPEKPIRRAMSALAKKG